ncbi:MAG: electron transport complex subunit RsxG [Gammaproteobacteria bacterium]|nr:electron transport complex subunit RsxG [Gammaproteobacteria bacterium]
MKFRISPIIMNSAFFSICALLSISFLWWLNNATQDRISHNQHVAQLKILNEIIPNHRYDNDLLNDVIVLQDPALGTKQSVIVHRAHLNENPVAALFFTAAPNGYGGNIQLLIGINVDHSLAGVRVITHRETRGLGDAIDITRSDWIQQFSGLSLNNPAASQWKVKPDGGDFDAFVGATITPRAVVLAIYTTLQYAKTHHAVIFSPNTVIKNTAARTP